MGGSEYRVELLVTSASMNPKEISGAIGFTPTSSWEIGDLVSVAGTRQHVCHGWILGASTLVEDSCREKADALAIMLAPASEGIVSLMQTCSVEVNVVAYAVSGRPQIELSATAMQVFATLGIDVVCDIYDLSNTSEPGLD